MMRRCRNLKASLTALLISVLSAVSCNKEYDFGFKDLCYYHPHTAPVSVNVDWSYFWHIERPTGMTVYVWSKDNPEENYSFLTHNLNSVTLDLVQGDYHAFVFNQTAKEYATLEFYNLDDFNKAQARVKQTKSNWYTTKLPDTKVGTEPEWLAIDCVEEIVVTEEMVNIAEEEFLAGLPEANKNKTRSATKSQFHIGTLTPKSIIKNLDVYVHVDQLQFLKSAVGVIDGMAEGCYISTGLTTPSRVVHELDNWIVDSYETGDEGGLVGVLKASLSTFGLPQDHTGTPEDNRFVIKLLLVDDKTEVEVSFQVGDLIKDLNSYNGSQIDENGVPIWPEVHLYLPEPLPEVEPVGGSGGFDVGVGGWGDDVVIDVPLM